MSKETLDPKTTAENGEITLKWEEASASEQFTAIELHRKAFEKAQQSGKVEGMVLDIDEWKRVFSLGRPKLVFSKDYTHVRIHKDSTELMRILTVQYLTK